MAADRLTRKLGNYFLQPLLQVKLGFYSVLLALFFVCFTVASLFFNFSRIYVMILDLTDLQDEVSAMLQDQMESALSLIFVGSFVYILATIALSIFYTHRLVGPTVAFRRHVENLRKGNYKSRVVLRKADAFLEVAEELNQLAEALEAKRS